jgi:hypothetical protein
VTANHVTLDSIMCMGMADIAALPVEEIALLLDDLREQQDRLVRQKERLEDALDLKYDARASAARGAAGKATGTVRFQDGDFVVIADLPKRVKWDQTRLAEAVEIIRRDWNDDPAQYIRTELKAAEAAYSTWPAAIRQLFEPARTLETSKPTYRIEAAGKETA